MDLWALGAVLYEAATGQAAFDPGDPPSRPTLPAAHPATRPAPRPQSWLSRGPPGHDHRAPAARPRAAAAHRDGRPARLPACLSAGQEGLRPAWADNFIPRASPTSAS